MATSKIYPLFLKGTSSPTVLIQLSRNEFKRHQHNCIHLEESYVKDGKNIREREILYNKIVYGGNIVTKRIHDNLHSIKLEEIKGRYLMITTTYKDACRWNPNLIIINSACSSVVKGSGILVLFVGVLPFISKVNNKTIWSKCDLSILRRCIPNII